MAKNSPEKTKYNLEYAKKNIKRIPLDVQNFQYEKIKEYAGVAGVPISTYIKQAIQARMDADKKKQEDQTKKKDQ